MKISKVISRVRTGQSGVTLLNLKMKRKTSIDKLFLLNPG
jgi:hypothetical protein